MENAANTVVVIAVASDVGRMIVLRLLMSLGRPILQ
jgi:hypothetical protein